MALGLILHLWMPPRPWPRSHCWSVSQAALDPRSPELPPRGLPKPCRRALLTDAPGGDPGRRSRAPGWGWQSQAPGCESGSVQTLPAPTCSPFPQEEAGVPLLVVGQFSPPAPASPAQGPGKNVLGNVRYAAGGGGLPRPRSALPSGCPGGGLVSVCSGSRSAFQGLKSLLPVEPGGQAGPLPWCVLITW